MRSGYVLFPHGATAPSAQMANLFEGAFTMSVNYKEVLLLAFGNFKEQNKFLKSFTIIINYCFIIITHIVII
jgi:hypothetical protein